MRKNPYLSQAENIGLDARSQNILKKAKSFGVGVYENPMLRKSFFDTNIKSRPEQTSLMMKFFAFLIESEKNVQMSKED